jgi:hypothetical protein
MNVAPKTYNLGSAQRKLDLRYAGVKNKGDNLLKWKTG